MEMAMQTIRLQLERARVCATGATSVKTTNGGPRTDNPDSTNRVDPRHRRDPPLALGHWIRVSRMVVAALAAATLVSACGGGGGNAQPAAPPAPIALPSLAMIRADVGSRAEYGTAADPMQLGTCLFNPPQIWQQALCADPPIGRVWPQANYYSTAPDGVPYWTLVVNNEPAFEVGPCTTGMPNRSRFVNDGPFSLRHDAQSITLRIEHAPEDNCRKTPYLAINNFESRTLAGKYGDGMHFAFTATAEASGNAKHLQYYHLFVRLVDAHGNPKFAWLNLLAPPGFSATTFNWNWPVAHSVHEPGAFIREITIPMYNAVSITPLPALVPGTTQAFDLDLDAIVKAIFPEDAVATTKIMGVEIAIEHDLDWSAPPPFGTISTALTLSGVRAYRAN
jgi:hypothetical protein